jgi:hypothetical protein
VTKSPGTNEGDPDAAVAEQRVDLIRPASPVRCNQRHSYFKCYSGVMAFTCVSAWLKNFMVEYSNFPHKSYLDSLSFYREGSQQRAEAQERGRSPETEVGADETDRNVEHGPHKEADHFPLIYARP